MLGPEVGTALNDELRAALGTELGWALGADVGAWSLARCSSSFGTQASRRTSH